MFNASLIVLSYHRFNDHESDYRFSRTYEQFSHDIRKKVYDIITIDDGRVCMIKACEMMRELNIRAKLFICTSLVGTPGYCTWDDIRRLSKFHDIENHSHLHEDHKFKDLDWQTETITTAQKLITENIGRAPRFFVPPYNQYSANTQIAVGALGLTIVYGRENILNISK
jgi:peptidoglycan/xylan/chitin deacetylase (PgdA/CDA1 family)